MSYAARLIHDLAIVTPTTSGALDADGDAEAGDPTIEAVPGLVQPLTPREIADSRSAGAELSDHLIFLGFRPRPASGAWISDNPADVDAGSHYDIVGVRVYDYGHSPHLEVLARLVSSTETVVAAGS